ncbi:MAG: AMP-binding protein, partial [Solirubrobacterales bacterium]|nr:AMP-binding protein [Solirubrobacterales bacterium]
MPTAAGHQQDAGARGAAPETVAALVVAAATDHSGAALRFHDGVRWTALSYPELGTAAREIASGLAALGIERGDRVSILASTRPDWTLADLGALCAGAVVAPIYDTNSPEECAYVLAHAGSRLVFCADAEQAAKVAAVRERCPRLEHVVVLTGAAPGARSFEELRALGREGDLELADRTARELRAADIATIVYTSGTTGPPKGCVTTHGNVMATVAMYERALELGDGERLSAFMFLPLAHSLARVVQFVVLDVGGTVAFWRGDPTRVPADLAELHPT